MNDLFKSNTARASAEFIALRDESRNAQMKNLTQEMWQKFSTWADPNFPEQFSQNVHTRFWEMYLGIRLLERSFKLVPKKSSFGPDFHISLDGKNIWVEATAPEDGTGKDAVPSIFELDGTKPVPEDKIILRFTNAISEKIKKREEYIKKGVIDANDAFVIALNGMGIKMILFEGPLPAIVRSVYPAGDYSITIDKNTLKPVREGYQTRSEISKHSGSPVQTNAFLNQNYSGISGILYSNAALWDMPATPGCEFLYIDNSIADTHLEADWLGIGKYCYKEENALKIVVLPKCA